MKLLIDNSGYNITNVGDAAMLEVALDRFARLLPGWELHVFTQSPERLRGMCPAAVPVWFDGRVPYLFWGVLGRLNRTPWDRVNRLTRRAEEWLRLAYPRWPIRLLKSRRRGRLKEPAMRQFVRSVAEADAVVATGGGFVTDGFSRHSQQVLLTLGLAQALGKPTAMFGQGLGPVTDPDIMRIARRVMPRMDVLALREGIRGADLARTIGVDPGRIEVTGDDAIELALRETPRELGGSIGVNLRLASYSQINEGAAVGIFDAISRFGTEMGAELLPVPISWSKTSNDVQVIADNVRLSTKERGALDTLRTARDVARQVGRCRLVVTGSYHAGVFALSQGVSVVGIAASEYYADKFNGLAAQFGDACQVIRFDDAGALDHLKQKLATGWREAPGKRLGLLELSRRQAASGRAAYGRWCEGLRRVEASTGAPRRGLRVA